VVAAASPGGSRSPQHGRTDCSLSLRAAVSGMSSVTVAMTQERSPRGRADGSIHLLLAWKRKRDRAAIARRTPAQHSSGRSKSALWRAADRRRGTAGIGAKMVWAQRRFRPGVVRWASSAQAMTTAAIEAAPALLGAAAARCALAPSYKFVDQGLGVPGRRSHYLVLASVKRTALHHHVRASQQPLVPSARRPAAEAETNTERERATTASVNAVAAYVGNTPAVFRVSNFDPRLCRR
jgi:hypothetical protein